MKKVIVVSKTHLDLGFTDFAETIRQNYVNQFIPNACRIAERLNSPQKKKFVWTTGSWILWQALQSPDPVLRQTVRRALRNGDLANHAMPFTLHTELLDKDTLEYGLSISDAIDEITGRKTTAAKMTDVPGHTAGLVPILAKHGIRLLHIGVNGSSAIPDVPQCFLWKKDGYELVVIYSGSYGGACQLPFLDEILYFSHTLDNRGAKDERFAEKEFQKVCKRYPDYSVEAGRIDDFVDLLWEKRDKLPVLEGEIGDSWIHGAASDPYKAGALRELIRAKDLLLSSGVSRQDTSYQGIADAILCLAEHTCGVDQKIYLSDYENYLLPDFEKARAQDTVKLRHPFRGRPHNLITLFNRSTGGYHPGSYRQMEKSWEEQRQYIDRGLAALPQELSEETAKKLKRLRTFTLLPAAGEAIAPGEKRQLGDYTVSVNRFGALDLWKNGKALFLAKERPALEFTSYGKKDYNYWFSHYTRDFSDNYTWSEPDFGRPLLEYATGRYPEGDFPFTAQQMYCQTDQAGNFVLCVNLTAAPDCAQRTGCPQNMQIVYTLRPAGIDIRVAWQRKKASRLPESTAFRLYPVLDKDTLRYQKCGSIIDPKTVVKNGNRKLSAVEKLFYQSGGKTVTVENLHAPLTAVGTCHILTYDNRIGDPSAEGLSYVLHDNIWGTNFPLWYEDDACFDFVVQL